MSDYAELKARLSIKADMTQRGIPLQFQRVDSAIMREAAAAIDALERKCADLIAADRDHAAATAGMKRRLEARAEAAESRVKRLEEALKVTVASLERADTTEGVCCCGDSMETHSESMACGHTPTDMGDYYAHKAILAARAALQEDKSHE